MRKATRQEGRGEGDGTAIREGAAAEDDLDERLARGTMTTNEARQASSLPPIPPRLVEQAPLEERFERERARTMALEVRMQQLRPANNELCRENAQLKKWFKNVERILRQPPTT